MSRAKASAMARELLSRLTQEYSKSSCFFLLLLLFFYFSGLRPDVLLVLLAVLLVLSNLSFSLLSDSRADDLIP